MILLAMLGGLRRGEIAHLHTNDIRGRTLLVTGKGGNERLIPIHDELIPYLACLPRGWFFPSDKNPTGHMLPDSIGQRLGDLLGMDWSGHTLRHRFATEAYAATLDIRAVQKLLGHQNLNTTMIYTEPPTGHLEKAVAGIKLPAGLDSAAAPTPSSPKTADDIRLLIMHGS